MRVRFYPIGSGSRGAVVVDSPSITTSELVGQAPCGARLESVDGTLVLLSCSDDTPIRLNGVGLSRGPVLPGDRLAIGDREFVVSYERTTSALPLFASYVPGG